MGKKGVMNSNIQPYTLNNKQIKEKIEDAISYNHSKYKKTEILFEKKNTNVYKLPFSDFKVAISQEIEEHKMLIEQLQEQHTLIPEEVYVEPTLPEPIEETVFVEEDPEIDVLDEIYDFDEEGKKPVRDRYRSRIKQVDTEAIVQKIKNEAIEKNKGKKVISFRDINKELKPYMIKKKSGIEDNADALTSIDIYLNAVNKIETNNPSLDINPTNEDPALELNIDDILDDLDK